VDPEVDDFEVRFPARDVDLDQPGTRQFGQAPGHFGVHAHAANLEDGELFAPQIFAAALVQRLGQQNRLLQLPVFQGVAALRCNAGKDALGDLVEPLSALGIDLPSNDHQPANGLDKLRALEVDGHGVRKRLTLDRRRRGQDLVEVLPQKLQLALDRCVAHGVTFSVR
jgi:hypothetical protein